MELIPAIDIMNGSCVRLEQGRFDDKKKYSDDPLEMARTFQDAGIRLLHLVDLDGARAGRITNQQVLERIAGGTDLSIDFGGGLRTDEDVRIAFDSGASKITVGSIAIKDRDTVLRWLNEYGPDRIILGADARNGMVSGSGWEEDSQQQLMPFIGSYMKEGITTCICTDILKDGMLSGSSIELYEQILSEFPTLDLVASGGVTTIDEIGALEEAGLYGAIIGKAIYEGKLTLEQIAELC